MIRRLMVSAALVVPLVVGVAGVANAASNPSGTGQPNTSCQTPGFVAPQGFSTGGFANAGVVYAGSPGTPSAANGNPSAVSQYDVACYQLSSNGGL